MDDFLLRGGEVFFSPVYSLFVAVYALIYQKEKKFLHKSSIQNFLISVHEMMIRKTPL